MNRPTTTRQRLVAALIGIATLLPAGAAQADYYTQNNPYSRQYNNWNNNFQGYSGGNREYRQQIRQMNPYGSNYRDYQRQQNSSFGGYRY